MSPPRDGVVLEVQGSGAPVRVLLPMAAFSPPAEQLRWDAFRMGHLKPADWSCARVQVEPVFPDGRESGSDFAFAVTLLGSAQPVRRVYRPGQLQLARMLLAQEPAFGSQAPSVTVYWDRQDPLLVPLAPMAIPVTGANGWRPCRELLPLRLTVQDAVHGHLVDVSDRSLARGAELGGALLGRFPNPDQMVIECALAAEVDGGSASGFRFGSRFWAGLAKVDGRRGWRIVGWFHSHLCDRGYPSQLSEIDLRIMHMHFAAPWLVTALVCASSRQPRVRWYHWQDGAVLERDGLNFPPLGQNASVGGSS